MRRNPKHPLLGLILAFAPILTGCAFNNAEGGLSDSGAVEAQMRIARPSVQASPVVERIAPPGSAAAPHFRP